MDSLSAYIPIDRRLALQAAAPLPDRTHGSALFADISGFTRLTRLFVEVLGRRRGAEEVLPILNEINAALIAEVHAHRGSVIGFSGDAITCWFDGDDGARAVTVGLAMQAAMAPFASVMAPGEIRAALTVKIAIAAGEVRRFVVGAPEFSHMDVLAGGTIIRMAQTERASHSGEVVVTEEVAANLGEALTLGDWRPIEGPRPEPAEGLASTGSASRGSLPEFVEGGRVSPVLSFTRTVDPDPWPAPETIAVPVEIARQWVIPAVMRRLDSGQGHFMAELRPAAALFVRFGGLDYDHDEAAGEKLDRYIRWVQGVAAQYEGALIQLTHGDKGSYYYIVFGAPVAHGDDPARAVAAALTLRTPPASLAFIGDVQIGVASGFMRTGAYGSPTRLTYGVLGEKTNLAARLMAAAPPGTIYCDAAVYAATRGQWEYAVVTVEADPKKGGAPLGAVYSPTGEMITHHSLPAISRDLVGRDAQVARLAAMLDEVLQGKTPLGWLEAEAGLGKSRLIAEADRLAGLAGFRVFLGAGVSIEQQTPYLAWREILGQVLGWDSLRASQERTAEALAVLTRYAPYLRERFPLLNDILPLGLPENDLTASLPANLRQENTMQAMIDLLRAVAQTQPLLLIFEDAHWMDTLSWELAARLARAFREDQIGAALLWVTRPLEPGSFASFQQAALVQLSELITIRLGKLLPDEIRQLLATELDARPEDIPAEIAALVEERADGNPFFAQELILTLRERGLIRPHAGAGTRGWEAAPKFSTTVPALPDTLQGLILARIDRLPPDVQVALKIGAVIGRRFSAGAVNHVLAGRTDILPKSTAEFFGQLQRQELLDFDEGGAYVFRHILTRDAAYETLLYSQRRELHEAVAGWYEVEYEDEALAPYYPVMVHHYRAAELPSREFPFLRLAASQAQARFANQDALSYVNRALELAPAGNDGYALHLQREEILGLLGDRPGQAGALAAALALAHTLADPARESVVAVRAAEYKNLMGDYEAAMQQAAEAVRLGLLADDPLTAAIGAQIKGQVSLRRGEYEAALAHLAEAMRTFETHDAQARIAEVYADLGVIHVYQGHYAQAVEQFGRVLAIHRALNNRREAARVQANMAGAYGYLGDTPQAIASYREALEINREIGEKRLAHIALGNLGIAYRRWGDLQSAERCLQQALEVSREIGDRRKEGSWLGSLGEIYQWIGKLDRAALYFNQALENSEKIGNRNGVAQWLIQLGALSRLAGNWAEARAYLDRAIRENRSIGNTSGEENALEELASLSLAESDGRAALACLEAARILRRALGQPEMTIRLLAGLAEAHLKNNQVQEASRYLAELVALMNETGVEEEETVVADLFAAHGLLAGLGDGQAYDVLARADQILDSRAQRIADPEMRAGYLNALPAHREVINTFLAATH